MLNNFVGFPKANFAEYGLRLLVKPLEPLTPPTFLSSERLQIAGLLTADPSFYASCF